MIDFLEDDPGGLDLACPRCPVCNEPPAFILRGAVQAFCGTEDCPAMTWNPSRSAVDNLADMHEVHWPVDQ